MNIYISLLLGFIIGYSIVYIFREHYINHGPNSNEIREQVFNFENKCYKFTPVPVICPTS